MFNEPASAVYLFDVYAKKDIIVTSTHIINWKTIRHKS